MPTYTHLHYNSKVYEIETCKFQSLDHIHGSLFTETWMVVTRCGKMLHVTFPEQSKSHYLK